MIYNLYAVKDAKTTYMPPTVDFNDFSARRNFEHAVQDKNSIMNTHPNDFALYRVGSFDNESGLLSPEYPPVQICDAASVLKEV